MNITKAQKNDSAFIARLIMTAMTDDCCQNLAGEHKTLEDFAAMMKDLVEMEDSQYSYRNTLIARTDEGEKAGVCVSYKGEDLHRLRQRFIEQAARQLDRDFSSMPDETGAGELYIDSLAVLPTFRRQGIATALLQAAVKKAEDLGMPAGLLVDAGNPKAERLYKEVGFKFVNDTAWAGHPMRHLQK